MTKTWLTVDCDDFRHIPKHQGHPTRSKKQIDSNQLSEQFAAGIVGFEKWFDSHNSPITLFVIADSLQNEEFRNWLVKLISSYPKRITIGCHGLTHRSWSAWPKDVDGFKTAITQAAGCPRRCRRYQSTANRILYLFRSPNLDSTIQANSHNSSHIVSQKMSTVPIDSKSNSLSF